MELFLVGEIEVIDLKFLDEIKSKYKLLCCLIS